MSRHVATAPGKLVLWGEYAVLEGAPAVVMAVSRFARVEACVRADADGWAIDTPGLAQPQLVTRLRDLRVHAPEPGSGGWLLHHMLTQFPEAEFPSAVRLSLDSTAFSDPTTGQKLGLGSSAAVCTALYRVLAEYVGTAPSFNQVYAAHRAAQHGRGSGIDVAASFHGGVLRYQIDSTGASSEPYPPGCPFPFTTFWTGTAATTTTLLSRLAERGERPALQSALTRLAHASDTLCSTPPTIDALQTYCDRLIAFDQAGRIGVYSPVHWFLHKLAQRYGVVYKPCGAGGGDVGIALAQEPSSIEAFAAEACRHPSVEPVALEVAPHGIQLQS